MDAKEHWCNSSGGKMIRVIKEGKGKGKGRELTSAQRAVPSNFSAIVAPVHTDRHAHAFA